MTRPADPLISAAGVDVSRDGRRVVAGVDLAVHPGQLVCLVGPNGAGKSTLLSALAGSLPVDAGTVSLLGDPIDTLSTVAAARRRAVLPQDHVVSGTFSCREVVQMARYPWNRTPANADDDAVVADAMTRCDVVSFADRPFATLSGGERARVALARVLAQSTPVLLLDEPTAAMDPHFGETVMAQVSQRVADGAAVVAVVHDLGLAAAYADTVVVLAEGRIVAAGPPADTLRDDLLTATYGLPMISRTVDGQRVVMPRRDRRSSPPPSG
ncbi:heme ABC transporter ATP-binding protein [Williamsia sterculiae]|uniref:Iron complex transport system ATP-binding protein n=1 Tax=Williamsia sterculiae TaxID=1344003 RepID=A0A1N7GRH7_9NOCA|nr:heme ABC transporter ATP-binding protein [Williamsia sterculiae]SIS15172.1 iron complex transport system ATP-binding protein [Williamsia sterculiae]